MEEVRELPPLPSGIRTLTDDEIERLRAENGGLPRSPRECVTCGGKEQFTGSDNQTCRCNCVDQFIMYRYFLWCGIGKHYQRLTWADVRPGHPLVDPVMEYLDNAETHIDTGLSLMFYGPNGTGKTLFAILLLKGLLAKGHSGYFTTFRSMLDFFREGFRDSEARQRFHRRVSNVDFLVLDELTMERRDTKADHDWPMDTLEDVVRHRVAHARPTILTTNYDPEDVKRGYGASVVSLLRERSLLLPVKGEDFRASNERRVVTEDNMGLKRPITVG